ncbi:MAG: hypothetical protein M1826_002762 [Phylliscum demangeonii]|nr:MAG: hypothetical protein M1826_002762 [Phylliscum demangeonii]
MSSFRQRRHDRTSSPTPDRDITADDHRRPRLVSILSTEHVVKRGRRRWTWLIFTVGCVVGIALAAFFADRHDMIPFTALSDLADVQLENLKQILPAGLVNDAKDLSSPERDVVDYDSFSVGLRLRSEGVRAHHPVIMIPGVITTQLESWGTDASSRPYFRKRLWGSWQMMRALLLNPANWKRHIMLDKRTGLDPAGSGIKLRAAQGFDATDFFVTGYWLWNKIVENLATIGYDPTNSFTASYDWRLAYANLEVRDQFFTRLQVHIETVTRISGAKAVLVSHSMGSQVLFYFMHWVEAAADQGGGGGGGGPRWVERHVDSWINISGSLLGALKGLPAVLSGEMKDTAQLNAFAVYGLDKFLSRAERAEIFRSMPGISSLLPKGGNAVWGNATWAPDDRPAQAVSFGPFINFQDDPPTTDDHHDRRHTADHKNLTVDESMAYLMEHTEDWYQDQVRGNYSHGVAHSRQEVDDNERDPRKWINPLETRLPYAPSLKIYCFYGVGKPTERAYFYRDTHDPASTLNVTIDTALSVADIDHGVVMGEGDGTVSLLSAGYMCARGWKIKRYNPAGAKVVLFEMPHEPTRFNPRGGPNTGDHVDILGRQSLNDLICRIAAGKGDAIQDHIVSPIVEYSSKVKINDDDDEEDEDVDEAVVGVVSSLVPP